MARNPNKEVRKSVIDLLTSATGLAVYENSIPLDSPLPSQYILVNSQSKRKTAVSKTCWDWEASFNINLFSVNEKGYSSSLAVDDIEEEVLTAMESLMVQEWHVKNREFIDSVSTVVQAPDHTINRITIVYNLWLTGQ